MIVFIVKITVFRQIAGCCIQNVYRNSHKKNASTWTRIDIVDKIILIIVTVMKGQMMIIIGIENGSNSGSNSSNNELAGNDDVIRMMTNLMVEIKHSKTRVGKSLHGKQKTFQEQNSNGKDN